MKAFFLIKQCKMSCIFEDGRAIQKVGIVLDWSSSLDPGNIIIYDVVFYLKSGIVFDECPLYLQDSLLVKCYFKNAIIKIVFIHRPVIVII